MSDNKKKFKHTKNSFARKRMQECIDLIKADVREAYIISSQMNLNKGYEPTPEELEKVEEQEMNKKMIAKLEAMRDKINAEMNTQKREKIRLERTLNAETTNLLHFFYIVRLAQQGFFYLVSSVLPTIEPQAITYLCDSLVSASVYASRSNNDYERFVNRQKILDLYNALIDEVDEPVAEGFRTTFKDIMQAAHKLMDNSINHNQDFKPNDRDSVPAPPPSPPVWFVMPYTSMIDSQMYALPGSFPTVPFPHVTSSGLLLPNNQTQKRQAWSRNKKNDNNNNTDTKDKERSSETTKDEQDQINPEDTQAKVESKEENDGSREEESGKEDDTEDDDEDDDDEDRFADPNMSEDDEEEDDEDDEEEEEEEEVKEEVNKEESVSQESVAQESVVQDDKNESVAVQDDKKEETAHSAVNTATSNDVDKEAAKANSSWLNFAASSPTLDSSTSSSRHRSRQNYKSPKNY